MVSGRKEGIGTGAGSGDGDRGLRGCSSASGKTVASIAPGDGGLLDSDSDDDSESDSDSSEVGVSCTGRFTGILTVTV